MSFFRSLRFKIAAIIIAIGIIPFLVCVPISLRVYRVVSINNDSVNLMSQAQKYANQIVTSGYYLKDVDNPVLDKQIQAVGDSYEGRILIIDASTLEIIRDSYNVDIGKTIVWENVIKTIKGEPEPYFDEANQYLIVPAPLTNSDGDTVGVFIITKNMHYISQNIEQFLSYMLISSIIVFSLAFILAVYASVHFTRPMRKMNNNLDSIIREHTRELPEELSYIELENISEKFNEIFSKMQLIDESRQEFVSNVSHELKTPLTSMKVLADSLNGTEDVPIEMYKEFMVDIGEEIDRETKIINDLLNLVRMDKSDSQLNVSAVNINELIEHILKRLKPIADKANIEVVFESFRPVVAEVDEVKFTLVITNLVENAIKYNNENGWVHISLNSDHQFFYIKVEDNGLGIPEDSVDHIFERFYRADKSHSREIGGTGLGLAITKSAIAMHNGEIKVRSKLGEGSTFDVRIPLSYIEKEAH
ncbi:MAG: cell wall metabolism sensor histidine kinase WalK [Pseudobutyrivibrio sp.]|nr:cell wall metabolism sensor histidine kinase WalK [Pseudobutyrivibrio sp.]